MNNNKLPYSLALMASLMVAENSQAAQKPKLKITHMTLFLIIYLLRDVPKEYPQEAVIPLFLSMIILKDIIK